MILSDMLYFIEFDHPRVRHPDILNLVMLVDVLLSACTLVDVESLVQSRPVVFNPS